VRAEKNPKQGVIDVCWDIMPESGGELIKVSAVVANQHTSRS